MPRPFWRVTAEAVVASVDAVYLSGRPADPQYISNLAQLTKANSEAALSLAEDLGLLKSNSGKYQVSSPLCRSFVTANQKRKATALRVVLEDYEPFTRFRERLISTEDATTAAKQVKIILDLDAHHDDIKETLLSLGQYSQALLAEGGGVYRPREVEEPNGIDALASGCANDVASEQLIRKRLGSHAIERSSRDTVIIPLANAMQRSARNDPRGAVVTAGNAVESYLAALGVRSNVNLVGKDGINAKAEELQRNRIMPKKLLNIAKYLGHIRNAADHGIDPDVGDAWEIRHATGLEYVFVACSFIASMTQREINGPMEI